MGITTAAHIGSNCVDRKLTNTEQGIPNRRQVRHRSIETDEK
jgi:hypothetical protein